MSRVENNSNGIFYGVCPRMTKTDVFYKIIVSDRAIYGVKIAGQIFDRESAEVQLLWPLGLILLPWINRLIKRREERERLYDTMDFGSREFLSLDKENFVFEPDQISKVTVNKKKRLWTARYPANGTIKFYTENKVAKELILAKDQDVILIANLIHQIIPNVVLV